LQKKLKNAKIKISGFLNKMENSIKSRTHQIKKNLRNIMINEEYDKLAMDFAEYMASMISLNGIDRIGEMVDAFFYANAYRFTPEMCERIMKG